MTPVLAPIVRLASARSRDETGAQGRLRLRDASRLAVGYGLAALVIVAVRLLERYVFLEGSGVVFSPAAGSNAPLPALLMALALGAAVLAGQRARRWPALTGLGAAAATFVLGALVARAVLPWWLTGWLSTDAVRVTGDLVIVASAGGLAALALGLTDGRPLARRAVLGVALAFALAFALLPIADLVVRAGLGTQGVYFAIKDLVLNLPQLLPMLVEDGPVRPALIGCAVLVFVMVAVALAGRTSSERVATSDVAAPFGIVAVAALALALAGGAAADGSVFRFTRMAVADIRLATSSDGEGGAFDLRLASLALPDSAARPNVVVVVLESVGARAVGAYAPDLPTTPFLDSLARAGVLVNNLSTTTPYTNKSLVSIFGGIPPSPASDVVEARPGSIPSPGLAALLKPLGYRSAFLTPARLAFERKDGVLANLGFEQAWGDGDFDTDGFEETNHFGFEDRVVLDRALDWMADRAAADEPFLLGMLTLTAHHPYRVPAGADRLGLGDGPWGDYLDAVRYTDDFVRDLVGGVERMGLLESTVFVFVGDHGEGFGEHAQFNHGNVIYEEVLRVPGIVFAPGIEAVEPGRVVSGPHQLIDVVPTVAQIVGAEWQGAEPPGQSLLADAPPERPLFTSCKSVTACQAIRVNNHKYIYRHGYAPTEVYDLMADPGETHDLASDTDPADVLLREGQIAAWTRSVRAAYSFSADR